MEGLLRPTHLFFLLLFVMFVFPVFIVVIVLVLLKRGKSPGPCKSSEKADGDRVDVRRGGMDESADKK
jgi:preprotein translocase subunit SecG